MEQKLDELLYQLHHYLFADAEQIISELRHFILDHSLKEAELAFISSKIFNSSESLLVFLRQNSQNNERILSTVKKRIYELIIEFMKHRKQEVSGYLEPIKASCLASFLGDQNSLVKEACIQVLIRLIETYTEIDAVIRPSDLMLTLLDEIKLRRPTASVKGAIWTLVGLMHTRYRNLVHQHIVESQDVQYQMLEEQVRTDKPEIKAIIGMLKGFTYSFEADCSLSPPQKNGLFLMLKTLMAPILDVNNRGVMKCGMKLMAQHANLFTDQIMRQALDLIERTLQLCILENLEVRDAANELLGSVIQQISDNLQSDQDAHVTLFKRIMNQFDDILQTNDYRNVQLLSAIRAVGIFSKAIRTILGDEKLWNYLERLTELSEQKLIKEFMDQQNPESDLQNFKYILKKQKQLIAYIESYSFIIRNLNQAPSDKFLTHFMKVGSIGVNNHRKLYNKYRFRFYESLAQLTMSLASFKQQFTKWIKKFIRESLTETLKIPDSVIFGGESPAESLQDAVMFWREFLNKENIWSQNPCNQVYDELISICVHDIQEMDLNYKVIRTHPQNQDGQEESEHDSLRTTEYVANNNYDQQYLVRLANFLDLFLPDSHHEWLVKWVPKLCSVLVKKASETPRISKLYSLLQTVLLISSKHNYFQLAGSEDVEIESERRNTFNMLLTFLKELIGKSEQFQDELLVTTMHLLLQVPIEIIYNPVKLINNSSIDNLHLWKGVILKALTLSQLNNRLAMTCIQSLETWFNALPVSLVAELYSDVLPKLSNFLQIEQAKSDVKADTYFFQDLLIEKKDEAIDRKDIANKVLDLLGKIGGHAHNIINNELQKKHDQENFIRWDPEKRLKFSIPMGAMKIDIFLDSCLPRIIDLAENSSKKETRIAACELLHALILYMIGKSATKPKGHQNTLKESENMAAFAKLYAKLFPVIIRLATEIELISRQLFQPLCFQIVRWFSSSKIYEHPEVESLLDALIEGAQSRNNSALREMCSNAVAVFAKWSLKQMTDAERKDNPINIKSLVRRIESNSNHPDPFKRLSSVLCFSKIFMVIKDFDSLIDRFCLEIARCVLGSLKMCHNSIEFSKEVIENCSELLSVIQSLIIKKIDILCTVNPQRSVHQSLYDFIDFLFSRFTSIETVYRSESIKLWEGLVACLPKKVTAKGLILQNYVPEQDRKPLFWSLQPIQFSNNVGETRKTRFQERQKQFDTLSAQLEFLFWLIKVAKFSYSDLSTKLRIDIPLVRTNLQNLFSQVIGPTYKKVCANPQKVLVCKEDKEQVTKSKIKMLTQLFMLFEQISEIEIQNLVSEVPGSQNIVLWLMQLALQIILVPASHQLSLLVQDFEIESKIRGTCEVFVKRVAKVRLPVEGDVEMKSDEHDLIQTQIRKMTDELPIIDLSKIQKSNSKSYHPRLLTNLLLGYLKLGQICPDLKVTLIEIICGENYPQVAAEKLQKKENKEDKKDEEVKKDEPRGFPAVIESWIEGEVPAEVESSRLLVSFMSKLKIPNEVLSRWLTTKNDVYQKNSDLLLQYIADNWSRDKVHVGEYLVQKAGIQMELLAVLIPIVEYVSNKTASYQTVFVQQIPHCWSQIKFSEEFAQNQVKIFCLIIQKCSWTFESKNSESKSFISYLVSQINSFLSEHRHSVYLKRQVLHLIGLLYNLNLPEDFHDPLHPKIRPCLESVLRMYLPIVSRDLKKNTNEAINYEHILEGFLDLLDFSKSYQILQILNRVIREHKPQFLAERLKTSLNNFVVNVINKRTSFNQFNEILNSLMRLFFDVDSDRQIEDNIRWAIAQKLISRILETCPLTYLPEIMVFYYVKDFKRSLAAEAIGSLDLYLLTREQTHVFLFLEIIVRRLDAEIFKLQVSKQMFGQKSADNELTKQLIDLSSKAVKQKLNLVAFEAIIILPKLNSQSQIRRRFACSAYTLLSSTVLKTQVKQNVYSNYLFGGWESIIDCSSEDVYNFSVQTNFNSINLVSIEAKASNTMDFAGIKTNNLLKEYVTSSFMGANEKFNSAMVFETQFDDPKQETKSTAIISTPRAKESGSLELDEVNKHECMKNIKRTLDRMQELFKTEWAQDHEALPSFMQTLLRDFQNEAHLNVKIFILKMLVNNQELFKPYAKIWLVPICNFISGKQTAGKGFHYFLRDLTSLLIQWSPDIPDSVLKQNQQLCSKVVNSLVRLAADKSKIIFNINVEILASLLFKWRQVAVLDKEVLWKMLNIADSVEGSHLWKMTAIQVVALACTFNLPVRSNAVSEGEHQFQLSEKNDMLFLSLLKMQELKKKQLIFASSEALGKILAIQPIFVTAIVPCILKNEANERHDIIVNVIERITRDFPQLLQQRRIFLKLLSFINVLTGGMRGAIFKSLTRYYSVCSEAEQTDISTSVLAISNEILADISDENQQNFLILLSCIIRKDSKVGKQLLEKTAHKLKPLFIENKNETSRELFFDLMVFVYDSYENFKGVAKSCLIRGLSDNSGVIQLKLVEYWNQHVRLDIDPLQRLQQLMTLLYDQEEEGVWLTNAIYLLLQVSRQSADFNRKIFDEPLQNCRFDPLHINQFNFQVDRSQPITPSLDQIALQKASQSIQQRFKQPLKSIKEEVIQDSDADVEMSEEMIDTNRDQDMEDSQEGHFKVAKMKSQNSLDSQSGFGPQMIRSTQGQPIFSPSQMVSSSLVSSKLMYAQSAYGHTGLYHTSTGNTPPEASLSAAFYDMPAKKKHGLKLFQVREEEQDFQREQFQESQFLVPYTKTSEQPKGDRSKFFEMNQVGYSPVQESQNGSLIRYIKDGSMPSQLARKDQIRHQQQQQLLKKIKSLHKESVPLLRQYRVGELPDIQIDYKDVLLPLMSLVRKDSTIATEVLVELFGQMFKDCQDANIRKKLGLGVSGILAQSIKFDYGVVNCMHRIAIELLKVDGFSIPADVIQRTGQHSMSFQTALILLEETILYGAEIQLQQYTQAQTKLTQKQKKEFQNPKMNSNFNGSTKSYWFSMISLNELVGNEDALKGIWTSMSENEGVMFKSDQNVNLDTAALIQKAQMLRSRGKIKDGLQVFEQALQSVQLNNDFEEQVRLELENKRYESYTELLKWDNITKISLEAHESKQLYEIPFLQAEQMIRSQIRCESQWQQLNRQMQVWQQDPISKVYLEKRFNYEQAIMFITARDFDRARFYINKESNDLLSQWKDLTKLSQVAQHILVQKIQKIYEMKEFLITTKQVTIKGQIALAPEALQQISNWMQRQPSYSYDRMNVWDDILHSRILYIDLYKLLFKQNQDFIDTIEGKKPNQTQIQNIGAILYAQCAKGAFKIGLYDTCDRYLMTCLNHRSKESQKGSLRIVVPIVKLKTQQFKQETINLDAAGKFQSLEKILKVLDTKIQNNTDGVDNFYLKALHLKQRLHQKLLSLLITDLNESQNANKELSRNLAEQIKFSFSTYDELMAIVMKANVKEKVQAKTMFTFSKLCDKLLRKSESSTKDFLPKCLNQAGQKKEKLAEMTIRNGFAAINLGYFKAREMIPRLLDVVSLAQNSNSVEAEFITASKDTPAWVFLRWINQMAAVLNRPESSVIADKLKIISRKYPHALYYPFKVIESNIKFSLLDTEVQTTSVFKKIQQHFDTKFANLHAWIEALDGLVHPEHRILYWITLLEDIQKQGNSSTNITKVGTLISLMIEDVASVSKEFVGTGLGDYNKKFAEKWSKYFQTNKIRKLSLSALVQEMTVVKIKMSSANLSQGPERLSQFSEYLSNLDNNDFYNQEVYIEIPGQYENLNTEPIPGKNVKLASIRKTLLTLGSIRRPKRITVHGSNEKDYNLLIKGGEDLRLDQRVQQIFQIMNGIFKEDPACQNRDLNLKTFNVIPITNRLGSLQWVDNTEPLKSLINREHMRLKHGRDLNQSTSLAAIRKWLQGLPGNEKISNILHQHLTLLAAETETVTAAFNKHKSMLEWSLLRNGLENLCLTSSAFITIKNQFVKSMAVFSIASYLIGIGDRHLENFLVNTVDGEILGIDFGCAFGAGVQQGIPELMPFRLTQQIEGVIAPHPMGGIYKQTMVHVLVALRKRKSLILDTCEIFVKEPLLDWVKKAQQKLQQQYSQSQSVIVDREEELEKLSFYPRNKIQVLKDKLNGVNPVRIVARELKESSHYKRPYYQQLMIVLQGPEGSVREITLSDQHPKYLDVEQQVDVLIELARDPDILGRAWQGWGPYI